MTITKPQILKDETVRTEAIKTLKEVGKRVAVGIVVTVVVTIVANKIVAAIEGD
jgi:hypothetical protein